MADVNGTRFHQVLGRRDWQPLVETARTGLDPVAGWEEEHSRIQGDPRPWSPARWDDAAQDLSLTRKVPRFAPPRTARALGLDDRRGADADAFGNLFWIAEDAMRIRMRPGGLEAVGDYWSLTDHVQTCAPARDVSFRPVAAPALAISTRLRGLAVTADHYLVAGTLFPSGLLVFDLHGSGGPCFWLWPEAVAFAPLDLARTPEGGLVILDRDDASSRARFWRLDRHFQLVDADALISLAPARLEDFHAEGEAPRTRPALAFPAGVSLSSVSAVEASDAVAIAALADGSVLILDAGSDGEPARVHRQVGAHRRATVVLDAATTTPQLSAAVFGAHDFVVVPAEAEGGSGGGTGKLYLVTREGMQTFVLSYTAGGDALELALDSVALPMQGFTGKALVASGGQVYYDFGERWIALAEQPRYRYFPRAVLGGDTLVFDGKDPGCVWHRLLLDACIPAGTEVRIESRATDERRDLPLLPWRREAVPYHRGEGSELPFHRPFGTSGASDPHLGTFETLFQAAKGRYLELRLDLRGDGRSSPRLRALRIHYPRFSYRDEYLPGVYREEPTSADFVERFLCNVEGLYTALEGRIERAEILFDPAVAPPVFLPWLAGWLGTLVDAGWEERRQRLFLRYAWLLFRRRGTPEALLAFLHLALDPCPDKAIFGRLHSDARPSACAPPLRAADFRIVENFQLRRLPGVVLGDPTSNAGPALVAPSEIWKPSNGASELHRRFVEMLRCRYGGKDVSESEALARLNEAWGPAEPIRSFSALRFSAVLPANENKAADWQDFAEQAFDFAYTEVRSSDDSHYREFLARRYGRIETLNQAWGRAQGTGFVSFAAVTLPQEDEFPAAGAALTDWIQFVSLALPIRRNAHRFTVLVPTTPVESADERSRRLGQVLTIVERERPAHTAFEVKPFWSLFQVGTARVGEDTLLGEGSRFVAMVLDAGHLGEGYLAGGYPWDAGSRAVVGRDSIRE